MADRIEELWGFEADDSELKLRRGSGFLAFLVNVFSQIFGPIVSIRVKTLSKTRLVASRHIKREKVSFPVDLLSVVAQKRLCLNFLWLDQDPDFFNIPPCCWLAKVLYLLIVTFACLSNASRCLQQVVQIRELLPRLLKSLSKWRIGLAHGLLWHVWPLGTHG